MLEPINWKGYFYTPENPDNQLPGILTFSQDEGIHVELFGQFKSYKNPASREENILWGFTSTGKKITLLNCYENSRSMSMPGFPSSAFSARYLLVGKHFEKPKDIVFDNCAVEYKDFNDWLNVSGFDNPVHNEVERETIIRYVQPDNISIPINENWTIDIEFEYSRPSNYSKPSSEARISQEPIVIFKPSKKMHLHEFEKVYSTFNSFLAMGYFCYPITVAMTFFNQNSEEENKTADTEDMKLLDAIATNPTLTKEEVDIILSPEPKNILEKVTLYYKTGLSYTKYKQHNNRTDFLFRYKTYQEQFSEMLTKWYTLKDHIDVSIDILTECFMDRGNTIEANFTNLTQALENIHRKQTGRDKPFNKRMMAIIEGIPEKVKTAILNGEKDFTVRVTNNRNYYTHYTVRGAFVPASLTELWILSQKLKLILLAAILQATGFTDEQVEAMILKKGMYLFNHIINTSDMKEYLRGINEKWD